MGIRRICTSGRWAINGTPIYVPDTDPEYGLHPIYSSDSGRLENGDMWKHRVGTKASVTLKYKYITGAEKRWLTNLTLYDDFSLTYYDDEIRTISSAYVGDIKYKGYNAGKCADEGGLYTDFELEIVEN